MTFRAIDITGLTPATLRDQPAPVLQWVAIVDLVIDTRYQRDLTRAGRRLIQTIADNFDWTAFGVVTVAPVPGGLFAEVEGQHRAHAAALAGLTHVPCLLVPMTPKQQAAAFVSINRARVRLDRAATYRAQLVSGNEIAVRAEAAVRAAGCELATALPTSSARKPGQVFTHGLILGMIGEGLDNVVTAGLRAVRDSEAGSEVVPDDRNLGLRVYDQTVLAIWLRVLADNNRFLSLPLADLFDEIPWLEWIETARDNALRAGGPSARARVTAQVEKLLRDALPQRSLAGLGVAA